MKRVLKFLRLIDENQNLSLTYLAVWIVLIKVAITPDFDLSSAGVLLIALLNYGYKKFITSVHNPSYSDAVNKKVDAVSQEVIETRSELSKLSLQLGFRGKDRG